MIKCLDKFNNYNILLIPILAMFMTSGLCNIVYGGQNAPARTMGPQTEIPGVTWTTDEHNWLQHHKRVRIAGPRSFPPFYYYEKEGTVQGLANDYAQFVMKKLGIEPTLNKNLPWPEVLEKIENRQIDLLACAAKTAEREQYLYFTKPYLSFPMMIVSRKDASFIGGLEDLNGQKIACITKNSTYEWLKRDKIRFVPYFVGSPLEGLKAVSSGQADFYIGNLAAISFLIEKNGLANLKVAAPTPYGNYKLYFAVRKDWPELVTIIDKVLDAMTPEQHAAIRNRWLSIRYEHGIRTTDILIWTLLVSVIACVVIAVITGWNRRLKQEVSERKEAEDALRVERDFVTTVIQHSPAFFVSIQSDGTITMMNQAMLKALGYQEADVIGKNYLSMFVPKEEREEVSDVFNRIVTGRISQSENHVQTKDGGKRLVQWHGTPVFNEAHGFEYFFGLGIDITESRKMEEDRVSLESQLYQVQKMEAIGTLAGGIAHDFNNILAAIIGYSELLQLKLDKSGDQYVEIDEIFKAGNRAKDLVRQILTFSRQTRQELQPVQVGIIVKEALKFLRASLPKTIKIRQNIQSNALILGDPTQIHQVLMNLCANSGHAMQKQGGSLKVTLEEVELTQGYAALHPDLKPGKHLKLTVNDTGHGMPTDVQARIFDPFFTTKEMGEGTGMGLSVVHGIVKHHRGAIHVHSEPGSGTRFTLYFPVEAKISKTMEPGPKSIRGGNESVLFVDDEIGIVDIGKQMLEQLGYTVTTLTSSIEALDLFKTRPEQFDLILTDLTMPDMTGNELAKKCLRIRPDIPIILCTGFSNERTKEMTKAKEIKAFLQKPILKRELAETIRKVLDQGDGWGSQDPSFGSPPKAAQAR